MSMHVSINDAGVVTLPIFCQWYAAYFERVYNEGEGGMWESEMVYNGDGSPIYV